MELENLRVVKRMKSQGITLNLLKIISNNIFFKFLLYAEKQKRISHLTYFVILLFSSGNCVPESIINLHYFCEFDLHVLEAIFEIYLLFKKKIIKIFSLITRESLLNKI